MTLAQATIEYLPLADNSVEMIFTDPPYAKEYLECYQWLAWEASRVLKPNGFLFAMAGGSYLDTIYEMFKNSSLNYFWEFHHKSNGDAPYIWPKKVVAKSKCILCYTNGNGMPRVNSILSIFESEAADKIYHEWGQDIASARYYIDCFSHKGDLVCDPFIGGGTTAVACDALQRRFVGFDIDMNALIISRDRIVGKRKENLHELPLFRNMNGTNGKAEIINPGSPRSGQAKPDRLHKDCVESPSHPK